MVKPSSGSSRLRHIPNNEDRTLRRHNNNCLETFDLSSNSIAAH